MSPGAPTASFVLTESPQAPPLFTGTKESIVADAKKICDTTRSLLDKVVADQTADKGTFNTVLLPQLEDENQADLSSRILGFYQYVSASEDLRGASTEAETVLDEFNIECNMREDVFKLVEGEYKGYIKNGLGLPAGEKRDRFKEIKKRLSQISIEFQKNLNEENGGIWFTTEQLEGVPEDVVNTLEKGTGENEGKIRLTFKYPDMFPTLKFAVKPETRREVFTQSENKINKNVPLFRETIELRDEAARLLGYPDHATLRIEDKMSKDPKTEIAHLLELKKADTEARGIPFDGKYYLWDHRYYDRLMIEKEYSIDEIQIANYFPLQSTVRGMLHIFEELLGFVFVELGAEERAQISPTGKAEDIVWHEDVILFSVWDDAGEGDGFVGYLYLDLHPRQGKYGHAANFNMQPGFLKKDGSRYYPATALVCNFSKPSGAKPSLLKHDEVVTLFHELGHGIHDLAGRTKFARFHGTSTSGEKIPDDLIEKLISTKHVNGALFNLRQLHFGIFDMTVHTPKSHEDLKNLNIPKLYNELRADICGLKGPEDFGSGFEWGNGQATFGHLMGGYDAGYYGYLSSAVYSADMFYSVFEKDPMAGKEGRRYRHTVLERGGSQDEMKTLEQFLGRKPSPEAFYKELGIPQ
ncbi:unnamed protein product [Parascedosporium putredinis]|uniref:Peptidase M3A/M3B catalytic domain-containing protein n=1 Tax=Parascedosporium putredinis TaxID=1442378 RepID=A0A9P1H3Z2_9PEZI|nr:unnamed protein product [Parascedosporium putredinis]CAI7995159.1 unnamed protein product [Parascedosporium putredinis]